MAVRILGELEVVGPGEVSLDISGARLRRLVTRLAVDADRIVGASDLVDAVWGDDPPADPVGALQTLVSRLRRALGSPALVQQAHQGYRLTVPPADVDVRRFRSLVWQGREALTAGAPAVARPLLVEALALWRGPALADAEGADYAVALATHLDAERLDALAARIDADLALGRAPEVVAELQDLAGPTPCVSTSPASSCGRLQRTAGAPRRSPPTNSCAVPSPTRWAAIPRSLCATCTCVCCGSRGDPGQGDGAGVNPHTGSPADVRCGLRP